MEYRRRRTKYKKPGLFRKIISAIAIFILVGIIASVVAFALLVDTSTWEDFDPESLTNVSQTLYVYDKNGVETAGVYNKENRTYVSIDKIPDHVVNAFIAIEDTRFYEHDGIDFIRFFGSLLANIKSMSFSQGFSTISQQLIKNTHLSSEKIINRKVQEMYLAVKLEQNYTKDQIMEMYLNYIYFGNGAYGIEAAALSYFNKDVSELTISEGAMLAGVIKATATYAPHINLDKSITRRNLVLKQMLTYGYITEAQYQQAINEAPQLAVSRPGNTEYGQFVDYALEEASEILGMSYEEMISSGYRIYTTMDAAMQKAAQEDFENDELFPKDASDGAKAEAAAVVIDSKTGAVKVLVAGREYVAKGINRAIDARRQPGSTIKPVLVYGPAVDRFGYTGASLIEDKEIDINGYSPSNYDGTYSGWVSMRHAVEDSINIPAVLVLQDIGVENGKAYAEKSGIPFDASDDNLALALGGFTYGVTPLEIAAAYQPYANQGIYNEPYVIESIEDSYGQLLYQHESNSVQVVDSSTAFIMTDIMKTTVKSGTAHRVAIDGVEIAGKTGTVSFQNGKGVNDAWTVAYTSEDIVAVWNGFDMPSSEHYMSSSETGGRYPAMMIHEILSQMYSSHIPAPFPSDEGVVSVKLDKVMYNNYHTIALATQYTPAEHTFYEYFKANAQPANLSLYWSVPEKVEEISVYLDDENQPVISFVPAQEYMMYTIVRQIDTEDETKAYSIGSFSGNSAVITYIDKDAQPAAENKYFVMPYNLNVTLENGSFLYGEYSPIASVYVPERIEDEPTQEPYEEPEPTPSPEASAEPETTPEPEDTPAP
ncbi:MAG: PBP1A family penicillin-binding protein [Clostridia bacterium]|nr:PBP1A family penicillin-binding protein [Clostridia bacterium]